MTATPLFQAMYLSTRWSRPIGPRAGFSASWFERVVFRDDPVPSYGLTLDNLAPWSSVWEGRSFQVNIRGILGSGFIARTGTEYSVRDYVGIIENAGTGYPEPITTNRHDERKSIHLSIQRPIISESGRRVIPEARMDYLVNSSNQTLYDYSTLNLGLGIQFEF